MVKTGFILNNLEYILYKTLKFIQYTSVGIKTLNEKIVFIFILLNISLNVPSTVNLKTFYVDLHNIITNIKTFKGIGTY